jgi:hypothetical protein
MSKACDNVSDAVAIAWLLPFKLAVLQADWSPVDVVKQLAANPIRRNIQENSPIVPSPLKLHRILSIAAVPARIRNGGHANALLVSVSQTYRQERTCRGFPQCEASAVAVDHAAIFAVALFNESCLDVQIAIASLCRRDFEVERDFVATFARPGCTGNWSGRVERERHTRDELIWMLCQVRPIVAADEAGHLFAWTRLKTFNRRVSEMTVEVSPKNPTDWCAIFGSAHENPVLPVVP